MQELLNKTEELEELAITLNDVVNEYSKIIMKIEEIHFLQLKIETKLENDSSLKIGYEKWKKEKLNLIFWFIRLGKYIANLKKQNITLTVSERSSLKNLMQFLTKYNLICQEETDSDIKEKIELQINSLFQNIFKTDKKLIKRKNIVSNIMPYFEFNPESNDNNVDIDSGNINVLDNNNNNNNDNTYNNYNYFQDTFLINLHTALYSNEDLKIPTCCYYDPLLPRKIISLLINDGEKNIVINTEEELNKINNFKLIAVKSSCLDVVEGWYKIEDIKII